MKTKEENLKEITDTIDCVSNLMCSFKNNEALLLVLSKLKGKVIEYANQSKWISVEGAEIEEGEYLTYNKLTDVTEVNYFDGQYWGYLASDRKEVTHYQAKPTAP